MFEGSSAETSSDTLAELARLGETRNWEPGATVVCQGDAADCMYLVPDGELRAIVAGYRGRAVVGGRSSSTSYARMRCFVS